jgi:C-terminal processing protease CtpA/Prc
MMIVPFGAGLACAAAAPSAPATLTPAELNGDVDVLEHAYRHPGLPNFAGRFYVLVDAANSSATFQFAQAVQQLGLGTLVGEPTGGNRRGINGGAFFFVQLPHSGIKMDLPLIATFPRTPQPDAGLLPDVIVPISAASIAAHADPVMDAVERMLAQTPRLAQTQ